MSATVGTRMRACARWAPALPAAGPSQPLPQHPPSLPPLLDLQQPMGVLKLYYSRLPMQQELRFPCPALAPRSRRWRRRQQHLEQLVRRCSHSRLHRQQRLRRQQPAPHGRKRLAMARARSCSALSASFGAAAITISHAREREREMESKKERERGV
jgi:hypothetical protein